MYGYDRRDFKKYRGLDVHCGSWSDYLDNYNNFYYDPYYGNFTYNLEKHYWSWSPRGDYSFNYSNMDSFLLADGSEFMFFKEIDNSFWCDDFGPYWYLNCDPYGLKEFN